MGNLPTLADRKKKGLRSGTTNALDEQVETSLFLPPVNQNTRV